MNIAKDLAATVGNTPLVRLEKIPCRSTILVKLESRNPLGSVKDRIAAAMIAQAESDGILGSDSTVIEPTSGNTGIGLAFVCARKGYRLILTMPETMSRERRALLTHLGAELVLTPGERGMAGAIERARELVSEIPGGWMPDQFANPANPAAHYRTTGPEIWEQAGGRIDFLVAGVGTGGTITGVGGYLKNQGPVEVVAVEPASSPVLSGGSPGPHRIQGIGAGFVPAVLDRGLIDEVVPVEDDVALEMARTLAREEGILCGISSGAALAAAVRVADRIGGPETVLVVVLPDTGERYLSTDLMKGGR